MSPKFVPYDTRQWQFIEKSFTSTAADTYEYSGVSFTVPANQIYEFVATDTKENARTTGILIADNNTSITNPTEKTTIAENKQTYTTPDDKVWIRQVSGITGKYNSALTYYVWVKRYSAHASTVSLAYHRIV